MQRIQWVSSSKDRIWQHAVVQSADGERPNLYLTGTVEQTVRGFGGCFNELGWRALARLAEADRRAVMRSLFDPKDGCGFSFCRIPIGASDFALSWYSLNESEGDYEMRHFSLERDRQYLLPYIRAAQAIRPDLQFFASPWSPPTWFKTPPVYNYGRLREDDQTLRAYALYLLKFVLAYQAEGVPVVQLHPQNEVVADQKFPSCVWEPRQLARFIGQYLGPLFSESGADCDIWLGTINSNDYHAWADTILSDEQARAFIKGVGYQYAGQTAVQRTHMSWPELELMQTEAECGSSANSWDEAMDQFKLMQHYFSNGVSSFIYWNMVLPSGGVSTWGWEQNSLISVDEETCTIQYQPEYALMRHFGQWVQPGAKRIGLSGPMTANALAFINPDGTHVVVAANPHAVQRALVVETSGLMFSAQMAPQSIHTFAW